MPQNYLVLRGLIMCGILLGLVFFPETVKMLASIAAIAAVVVLLPFGIGFVIFWARNVYDDLAHRYKWYPYNKKRRK